VSNALSVTEKEPPAVCAGGVETSKELRAAALTANALLVPAFPAGW
jgi:hypothetical protein